MFTDDPIEPNEPLPLLATLWEDVASFHPDLSGQSVPAIVRARLTLTLLLGMSGARVTFLYRLAHTLHHRCGGVGRRMAGALGWWVRHWYGCDLSAKARIGGGLVLPHPQGISVGPGVVIGYNAWIFQNVSLSASAGDPRAPRVGKVARLLTGALLRGPVTLGDHVQVGANAIVQEDVPDGARVVPPRPTIRPITSLAEGLSQGVGGRL